MKKSVQVENAVLGLDLGSNSIGWAILSGKNGEPEKILDCGVRIFEAGTEGDISSGRDESRAKARRDARLRRRMLSRRARRLLKLAHILQRSKLLPEGEIETSEKRDRFFLELDKELFPETLRKQFPHTLPYILRAQSLDKKLGKFELGRAIYHLAQRRGFYSNRKSTVDKKEEGVVKKGISELAKNMELSKARTLGEYFSKLDPEEERIRGRWTSRKMYKEEFDKILGAQQEHYPDILNGELKKKIHKAIFFQRPIWWDRNTIGKCSLEKNMRRAAISLPIAQRFRMHQKVNDMTAITPDGEIRPLEKEEREILIGLLENQQTVTFGKIRTMLKLKGHHFNFEEGGEKSLKGNDTSAKLKKVFGGRWDELSDDDKDLIVEDLRGINRKKTLLKRGMNRWELSEEKAKNFSNIVLEDGHCSLSRKALEKIVPLMEEGMQFATAKQETYGEEPKPEPTDMLPPLDRAPVSEVRNPVVQRGLTELRKVLNTIIKKHGKPTVIRIEMARDIKKTRDDRKKIWKNNLDNRANREKAVKKLLEEAGLEKPSGQDIEKWLLAEECGWLCPYTGKTINAESLFRSPQFEVEHIVPWRRCFDNSFYNKTLCHHEENRNKGNKTPWEAYGGTEEKWEQIIQRVKKFNGRAAKAKLQRFQLQDIDDLEGFISRQLNDTRYISRLANEYIGLLYGADSQGVDPEGKKIIQATRGKITGILRNVFDLNRILNDGGDKSRDDHRHHAVDAICIALTSPSMIKKLSDSAKKAYHLRDRFSDLKQPWPDFAREAAEAISNINVSHRISKKVNESFHDETTYSKQYKDEEGRECVHVRKPLGALSAKDVNNIVDVNVRKAVKEKLLESSTKDPKKAFKDEGNLPFLQSSDGSKTPIKSARIRRYDTTFPVGKKASRRRVMLASNSHMEILETKNKKGQIKWEGTLVSRYEAMQRLKNRQPIINRDHGEGKKFLFSLSGGELIELDSENGREIYRVRTLTSQKRKTGPYLIVEYVNLADARMKKEIQKSKDWITSPISMLYKRNCRKIEISPIGKIVRAND